MFKFNTDGIVTEEDVYLWNLESYNSRTKYKWPKKKGGASLPPRSQASENLGKLKKGSKIEFTELLFDNSTVVKDKNKKYLAHKIIADLPEQKGAEGFVFTIYAGKVQIEEELNLFKSYNDTLEDVNEFIEKEAENTKKKAKEAFKKLEKTLKDNSDYVRNIFKFKCGSREKDSRLENFLEEMEKKVGKDYYLGGGQMDIYQNRSNKNLLGNWKGFDCCGGIMHSISEVTGATVPGGLTAGGMYAAPWLESVDKDKTEPGDLVFFYNGELKEWRGLTP